MIGLSLALNNKDIPDLHFSDGHLVVATGNAAIGQHVAQRIKTFLGEWFLDTDCGVDWLGKVFGQPYNKDLYENMLKSEIADTIGVKEITTFSASFDLVSRGIKAYDISVITESGEEISI